MLAQMLMKPIDTAAAEADMDIVGKTQNGDCQKKPQKLIKHSQSMTTPNG